MFEMEIPCSPEQEDVIADYLLNDTELGMLPDERAWILSHVRRKVPNAIVTNATLSVVESKWLIQYKLKS